MLVAYSLYIYMAKDLAPFVLENETGTVMCNKCVRQLFMSWVPCLKYII